MGSQIVDKAGSTPQVQCGLHNSLGKQGGVKKTPEKQ